MKRHRTEILVFPPALPCRFLVVKQAAEALSDNAVLIGTLGLSPLIDRRTGDGR